MNRRPLSARFPGILLLLILLIFPWLVAACGASSDGPLLSAVTADAGQLDLSQGANQDNPVSLEYHIGQSSRVSITLQAPDGKAYLLRQNEVRPPGAYTLVLPGVIDLQENNLTQTRLLTNGNYRYQVQAVSQDNGAVQTAEGQFVVKNSPVDNNPPQVDSLFASPAVISPNFDAREDTSVIGWRTTQPATVTVSIAGPNDYSNLLTTLKNLPAQENKVVFNGLDQKGEPLDDGVYTYTIQAADAWGNITRQAGSLEIKGGGRPQAVIEQASISPTEIIQGNLITVTVRVRNTGKVPIRTQGPDSGYMYTFDQVYTSIEGGKYKDSAGFWRIGVDYESNSGGGPSRYPFRWGFGHDLQPGEAAEIIGVIKVDRPEAKLKFYVGLIQEQIRLPQDHIQVTEVTINH
jgi:hypothetical protein